MIHNKIVEDLIKQEGHLALAVKCSLDELDSWLLCHHSVQTQILTGCSHPVSMSVQDARNALNALTEANIEGLDYTLLKALDDGRLRQDGYMRMEFDETVAKYLSSHHDGDTKLILLETICFLSIMHHENVEWYHLDDEALLPYMDI